MIYIFNRNQQSIHTQNNTLLVFVFSKDLLRLPSLCPYIVQHVQDTSISSSIHSLIGGDEHSQGSWTP